MMIQKITKRIGLCALALSMTACFELSEEITLQKNGTGMMEIKLNAQESKFMLDPLLQQKSSMKVQGFAIPSKDESGALIKKVQERWDAKQGISNTQMEINWDQYIVKLKFNFASLPELNQALNTGSEELHVLPSLVQYNYNTKKFERKVSAELLQLFKDSKNDPQGMTAQLIQQMGYARYVFVANFDKEPKPVQAKADVSVVGKKYSMQKFIKDLADNPLLFDQSIVF
jgi:hypothetical protein